MVGGLSYANDLTEWLKYEPKDPDHNLAASWHSYNFNHCNKLLCWTSQVGLVINEVSQAERAVVLPPRSRSSHPAVGRMSSRIAGMKVPARDHYSPRSRAAITDSRASKTSKSASSTCSPSGQSSAAIHNDRRLSHKKDH